MAQKYGRPFYKNKGDIQNHVNCISTKLMRYHETLEKNNRTMAKTKIECFE